MNSESLRPLSNLLLSSTFLLSLSSCLIFCKISILQNYKWISQITTWLCKNNLLFLDSISFCLILFLSSSISLVFLSISICSLLQSFSLTILPSSVILIEEIKIRIKQSYCTPASLPSVAFWFLISWSSILNAYPSDYIKTVSIKIINCINFFSEFVIPVIICKIIRIPVFVKSTLTEILFKSLIHFTHFV